MSASKFRIANPHGFTLVEIIATIIVMGILASFFIHFMGTAMDDSWKSVELVTGEAEAEAKIEEIIAYFTSQINDNADLANALSKVVTEFSGDATLNFIVFNSATGNEENDILGTNRNLKVTVEAPGNNLTTVLTRSRINSTDQIVYY
ncbi:MAG: type II secretion system protein [Desulfobacterales bacterium]|nr:type II secretion system protein [Desulfobacterales bacterium]